MAHRTHEVLPSYEAEAPFYDYTWGDFDEDLRFYRRQLDGRSTILDCMCGTGRVALALARAGCQVDGVDSSPGMLRMARRKLIQEPSEVRRRVRLIKGDLRSAPLSPGHDAAIIAVNSYGLMPSRNDRVRALRQIRHALGPMGKLFLALDTVSSYRRVREGIPFLVTVRPVQGEGVYVHVMTESGGQTDRVRTTSLHLLLSRPGGSTRAVVSQTVTTVLSPSQVRDECREAGLWPAAVIGDYDGRSYSPAGGRFILEASV